ncbi:MAG TPA: hypothetical protein VGP76_27605 [Planctomycetaceae bacterium]|nr:hypothetical protein [Planctomycetaceae bacterium]
METYRGDFYRYLAREIIQNSLDAARHASKPVIVEFNAVSLKRTDIPGMGQLTDVLQRCKNYWAADSKAKQFFARAAELAQSSTIDALHIRDFNTTGVVGEDHDRTRQKNWYSLIRSSGSSTKEAGEGGSYGIGKNAPFAASNLRTVLYSTSTGNGKNAFQGVARLVTHEDSNRVKCQNVGYLGGPDGRSIRKIDQIPSFVRRTERGTDLVILGYITERTWQEQLRVSVLENFWPAIHFRRLEVRIGNLLITKKNLATLLEAAVSDESFSAHQFYEAFLSPTVKFDTTLPHLRDVSLYLRTGTIELPKRVAMVRQSGMVVYLKHYRAAMPYCGVFMCSNDEGNALLRAMEPPRHDMWDPNFPDKGANTVIEREFGDYIRQCLRDLAAKDDTKVIAVPELSRFLPDDEDSPEDSFGGPEQSDQDKVEGFPKDPLSQTTKKQLPVSRLPNRKPQVPLGTEGDDDGDDYEGGTEEGGGGGGGGGGSGGGSTSKPPVPVQFRAFAKDSAAARYTLLVRAESSDRQDALLRIQMVGDDAREPVRLKHARLSGGKRVQFSPAGTIGPVQLSAKKPLCLEIELTEPGKIAMEVIAHEA